VLFLKTTGSIRVINSSKICISCIGFQLILLLDLIIKKLKKKQTLSPQRVMWHIQGGVDASIKCHIIVTQFFY